MKLRKILAVILIVCGTLSAGMAGLRCGLSIHANNPVSSGRSFFQSGIQVSPGFYPDASFPAGWDGLNTALTVGGGALLAAGCVLLRFDRGRNGNS